MAPERGLTSLLLCAQEGCPEGHEEGCSCQVQRSCLCSDRNVPTTSDRHQVTTQRPQEWRKAEQQPHRPPNTSGEGRTPHGNPSERARGQQSKGALCGLCDEALYLVKAEAHHGDVQPAWMVCVVEVDASRDGTHGLPPWSVWSLFAQRLTSSVLVPEQLAVPGRLHRQRFPRRAQCFRALAENARSRAAPLRRGEWRRAIRRRVSPA